MTWWQVGAFFRLLPSSSLLDYSAACRVLQIHVMSIHNATALLLPCPAVAGATPPSHGLAMAAARSRCHQLSRGLEGHTTHVWRLTGCSTGGCPRLLVTTPAQNAAPVGSTNQPEEGLAQYSPVGGGCDGAATLLLPQQQNWERYLIRCCGGRHRGSTAFHKHASATAASQCRAAARPGCRSSALNSCETVRPPSPSLGCLSSALTPLPRCRACLRHHTPCSRAQPAPRAAATVLRGPSPAATASSRGQLRRRALAPAAACRIAGHPHRGRPHIHAFCSPWEEGTKEECRGGQAAGVSMGHGVQR